MLHRTRAGAEEGPSTCLPITPVFKVRVEVSITSSPPITPHLWRSVVNASSGPFPDVVEDSLSIIY
jgi:hypothetical protein